MATLSESTAERFHNQMSSRKSSLHTRPHLDEVELPNAEGARVFGAAIMASAKPVHRYSRLYCRFNGFMFGVFANMCWRKPAKFRYRFYRERMHTFLKELDVALVPPVTHADYQKNFVPFVQSVIDRLRPISRELLDFFHIGMCAIDRLMMSDPGDVRAVDRHVAPVLRRHGHAAKEWALFSKRTLEPARNVNELVSPALWLLSELIRPLPVERRTCFVAMPFRKPFEAMYASFYRPLLDAVQYRALRAWGGFGNEDFSPSLAAAILKSGAMLGDITGLNKNVLWEIGVAQGAGKWVFLLRSRTDRADLSDLSRHLTLRYDRRPPWPRSALERLVFPFIMAEDVYRTMPRDRLLLAAGARKEHLDVYGQHILGKVRERYGRDGAGKARGPRHRS